jgi:hypothetical protein
VRASTHVLGQHHAVWQQASARPGFDVDLHGAHSGTLLRSARGSRLQLRTSLWDGGASRKIERKKKKKTQHGDRDFGAPAAKSALIKFCSSAQGLSRDHSAAGERILTPAAMSPAQVTDDEALSLLKGIGLADQTAE